MLLRWLRDMHEFGAKIDLVSAIRFDHPEKGRCYRVHVEVNTAPTLNTSNHQTILQIMSRLDEYLDKQNEGVADRKKVFYEVEETAPSVRCYSFG